MLRQQEGGEHRRDGEGRKQRPDQRVAVGPGHRAENLPFDALHGEQRHEGRHVMAVENNTALSTCSALSKDQPQPVGPGR